MTHTLADRRANKTNEFSLACRRAMRILTCNMCACWMADVKPHTHTNTSRFNSSHLTHAFDDHTVDRSVRSTNHSPYMSNNMSLDDQIHPHRSVQYMMWTEMIPYGVSRMLKYIYVVCNFPQERRNKCKPSMCAMCFDRRRKVKMHIVEDEWWMSEREKRDWVYTRNRIDWCRSNVLSGGADYWIFTI